MFSVVIPLYNKEQSVSSTIQSVLDQSFQDFEIVIVNDGSSDNSVKRIEEFKDERIRLIHQENQGVSAARNKGIEEAKYDWVALLDGDDLWKSNHLETLKDMIEKYPEDKVFCTSFIHSNENENEKLNNEIRVIDNYFKEAINGHVTNSTIMCFNKEVVDKVGSFNIQLNRGEDLDLWARIGREYRYIKSNLITAIYRLETENRSNISFSLEKSRVYNYNFKKSSSKYETIYYTKQIASTLRGFIRRGNIKLFWKLKQKHRKYISYIDVIKK